MAHLKQGPTQGSSRMPPKKTPGVFESDPQVEDGFAIGCCHPLPWNRLPLI